MAITLVDKTGKAIGTADVPAVFEIQPKSALLHQAVTRHLANRRAGTASTKTRDEVAGGGRQPRRPKSNRRARGGRQRSPVWGEGGRGFWPHAPPLSIPARQKER